MFFLLERPSPVVQQVRADFVLRVQVVHHVNDVFINFLVAVDIRGLVGVPLRQNELESDRFCFSHRLSLNWDLASQLQQVGFAVGVLV